MPSEKPRLWHISWVPLSAYLLKKGSQVLTTSEMSPSLCNFTSANEPSPQSLTECLPKGRRRHLSAFEQIKHCSHRLCYLNSISDSDVVLREISEMEDEHAGDFAISPEASWYSHVQLRWHWRFRFGSTRKDSANTILSCSEKDLAKALCS